MTEGTDRWQRAVRALDLLRIDPGGLGGLLLRARSSPVRDLFIQALEDFGLPRVRLHPAIGDDVLFGALDLAQTLALQKVTYSKPLASRPSCLVLAMAERCPPSLAARLAQILDSDGGHCLIALDEAADADEGAPVAVRDRLAFHVDLDGLAHGEASAPAQRGLAEARSRYPAVSIGSDAQAALVTVAARFGIVTLRAPLLAARAACAHAALMGRLSVAEADLQAAAQLVLAPRATRMPIEPEETPAEPPENPPPDQDAEPRGPDLTDLPDDILVAAMRAALPANVLEGLSPGMATRSAQGSGAGARRKGNRRGRPLPARAGRLDGRARIDLVATLRTAAPWQTLRRAYAAPDRKLVIYPSDIRLKHYEDRSDRLLIFTVDASGSAAMARLAEAKGAVELLLAQAYARRDHVALVAFRGDGAEVLLPPTRSLVQTKRRLAALPGGGGTPLAAGLRAAADLADSARRQGLSPAIALLTDGRANIALDGRADRAQAAEDALMMAGWIRNQGGASLVLDVGMRPMQDLRRLADRMGGVYMALPRADAHRLSGAIGAALEG
jgi:magnesium chelatase subunit D